MAESGVMDKTGQPQTPAQPRRTRTARAGVPCGLVAAAALLTFFTALGSARLFDQDEPKNAACAREMFDRGDWIVPTFNAELRTDKPILLYWLMLGAYHVFGVSEFAVRFWSALLGVGTCLLTFDLGRLLFCRKVGTWAGLIMSSTLMFTAVARAATPDSTLIFLTTLSLDLFARMAGRQREEGSSGTRPMARGGQLSAVYAVMALAVLAKGPVGIVLPYAVIALFLYVESAPPTCLAGSGRRRWSFLRRWLRPGDAWRVFRNLQPWRAAALLLLIAGPWSIAVTWQTNGVWLEGFLGDHNLKRFLQPREGHGGSLIYYVLAVLAGFFPWSVFLPTAMIQLVLRLRSGKRHELRVPAQSDERLTPRSLFPVVNPPPHALPNRSSLTFLACWISVYLVFFTLARTKLPNYVLPCYPALALLTGWALVDRPWRTAGAVAPSLSRALLSLAIVGVVLGAGLGIAAAAVRPDEAWLGLVGLVLAAGGTLTGWLIQNDREQPARRCLATTVVLFILALFGVAGPRLSTHQDGAYVAAVIQREQSAAAQVATFRYSLPSLVFYTRQPIRNLSQMDEVSRFFAHGRGCLVTTSDCLDELTAGLPASVTILARRQQLLRPADVVVLGCE